MEADKGYKEIREQTDIKVPHDVMFLTLPQDTKDRLASELSIESGAQLSHLVEMQGRKAALQQIAKVMNPQQPANFEPAEKLLDKVFETRLEKICYDFIEGERLFKLDLSMFPDDFFYDPTNRNEVKLRDRVRQSSANLDGAMTLVIPDPLGLSLQALTFKGYDNSQHKYADFLAKLFPLLLEPYGYLRAEPYVKVSALETKKEDMQRPHRDYFRLSRCKKKQRTEDPSKKKQRTEDPPIPPTPWSADMPKTPGGLKLNVWVPEKDICDAKVIEVKYKEMLFFRGDVVHSGGYRDLNGGSGYRMHFYIPLVSGQDSIVAENQINCKDEYGKYYDTYLTVGGKPFKNR